MAIDNPEAIRWVNEVIRPHAERMRALKATIDSALVTWYAGMSTLITNTADAIDDGREAEGVSRLLGTDVVNLVTQMAAYKTACEQTGVANVISKPCVRSLEVS